VFWDLAGDDGADCSQLWEREREWAGMGYSDLRVEGGGRGGTRSEYPQRRHARVTHMELGGDFERDVGIRVVIDTNVINARGRDDSMNQLEHWNSSGVIEILLPETAHQEAVAGGDTRRVAKANAQLVSESLPRTPEEHRIREQIAQAVFPSVALTRNQAHDVDIVFNCWKYGSILVTNDGDSRKQPRGILGSRVQLEALSIRVMRPAEAVTLVRSRIVVRDEQARQVARTNGCALPSWIGED